MELHTWLYEDKVIWSNWLEQNYISAWFETMKTIDLHRCYASDRCMGRLSRGNHVFSRVVMHAKQSCYTCIHRSRKEKGNTIHQHYLGLSLCGPHRQNKVKATILVNPLDDEQIFALAWTLNHKSTITVVPLNWLNNVGKGARDAPGIDWSLIQGMDFWGNVRRVIRWVAFEPGLRAVAPNPRIKHPRPPAPHNLKRPGFAEITKIRGKMAALMFLR